MKTAAPSRGAAAGGYSEKPQNKHRTRSAQAAQHHLTAEWLSLRDATRHDLECLGITREAMHRAGGLAKARITTIGRLWRPDFSGRPAYVIPVWDGLAPSIYRAVEHPRLLDLVADLDADLLDAMGASEFWPVPIRGTER